MQSTSSARLVLIVDPDRDFVEDTRSLLRDERVLTARSLDEAVEIAVGGRLDLAVLGPFFGTEQGVMTAGDLLRADPDLQIVLAANVVTNRILRAALRVGFSDVIDTPVTVRKLNDVLSASVRRVGVGVDVVLEQEASPAVRPPAAAAWDRPGPAGSSPPVGMPSPEVPVAPAELGFLVEPQGYPPGPYPDRAAGGDAEPYPPYAPEPYSAYAPEPETVYAPEPHAEYVPERYGAPEPPADAQWYDPAAQPPPADVPESPEEPAAAPYHPTTTRSEPAPPGPEWDETPPMPAAPPPMPETGPPFGAFPEPAPSLDELMDRFFGPDAEPRRRGGGRFIAVIAGKGGSGKTVTAVNLAVALAESGAGGVALVDADRQFGDVALLLQLDPRMTIADAAARVDEMSDAELDTMMMHHESGIRVLPAPLLPVTADEVPAKHVVHVAQRLQRLYEYVVVDTAPVFDDQLLEVIAAADDVLLVVDMDLPSVKNARIALDTLRRGGFPMERLRLVVNRVNSKARLDLVELERSLGMRVFGAIPSDRLVPQSVNEGIPAIALAPKSKLGRAFVDLATALTGDGSSGRTLRRR